jgi:broad specificity phosphatase PhoE
MTTAARYLYPARHGEATDDESGLSANGRRQAALLGERLRHTALSAIHHGPLPRAARTARVVAEQLDGVPLNCSEPAGDHLPYLPARDELPPAGASGLGTALDGFPAQRLSGISGISGPGASR